MSKHVTFTNASWLTGIAWNKGILTVTMNNGKSYRYADVPETLFDDFAKAESAGKFFGAHVRGKFEPAEKEGANV